MYKNAIDSAQPSKNELIRWLHAVEHATPRRLAGLLTELYFSRHIRKSSKYRDVAEGWAYIPSKSGLNARYWFKIFQDRPTLSPAEEHFLSCLTSSGHRFFSLSLSTTAIGAHRLPNLELEVEEFSASGNGWTTMKTPGAVNAQTKITKRLTVYLETKVHVTLDTGIGSNLPFKRWVENLEISELEALFLQRCFMNCRKPSPLDLDAVALTHDGRIAFVEFKRKYPTNGTSKPLNDSVSPTLLTTTAYEIAQELRTASPKDFESAKGLFSSECKKREFKYVPTRSYGLDMAHFETLKLCSENGIAYDYCVWNSDNEPHKGAYKLPEVIADLESVLTNEIAEKQKISWWNRTLQPTDACGLTFTWGDKSGSYDDGCRLQITFDER